VGYPLEKKARKKRRKVTTITMVDQKLRGLFVPNTTITFLQNCHEKMPVLGRL
jgi:hypothetical protein